jgi:uncharacterized protein YecT (DUF1311 family)
MRLPLFLFTLAFSLQPLAFPQEAKARFDKADAALNQAWSVLKKKLPAEEFKTLQAEQREWLRQRDYLALSPSYSGAPADPEKARQSPEYFLTMAGLTETRTRWLTAYAQPLKNNSLTGIWNDSNGGDLQIVEKEGKLYFSLSVVRGPTAHLGDIGGIATWKSPRAFFSDKGLDPEKKDETTLTFTLKGTRLEIVGSNTSYYHGARAYFDGTYLCIGSLTPEEQAKLIQEAK